MKNNKNVYILGAGASVHAGYPVVNNFKGKLLSVNAQHNKYLSHLFGLIKNIFNVFPNENIEEIIAIASNPLNESYKKMSNIIQTFTDYDQIGSQYVLYPLKIAIMYLLYKNSKGPLNTKYIDHFIDSINGTLVTFNWDNSMDMQLYSRGKVSWFSSKFDCHDELLYLKLHGSADTLYCQNCKEPFFVDINVLLTHWMETNYSCPYCGSIESHGITNNSYSSDPLLIGFSDNKKAEIEYIPILQMQWNKAREMMIKSDKLVIIGFSMNEIDKHVIYFFDSILRMRKQNWIIEVVNPDRTILFKKNVLSGFGQVVNENNIGNEYSFVAYDKGIRVIFIEKNFEEYTSELKTIYPRSKS